MYVVVLRAGQPGDKNSIINLIANKEYKVNQPYVPDSRETDFFHNLTSSPDNLFR